MPGKYDAIIIGGGHNGLVTACYLARAKWVAEGVRGVTRFQREALLKSVAAAKFPPP